MFDVAKFAFIAAAFGLAAGSAVGQERCEPDAAPDALQTLTFEGYVYPSREAELTPLVDNVLTEIAFHAGQYVEEGDLLFEFGKKGPLIEMKLSETALKDALAQLRLADAELNRKTELFLKELIADAEFQVSQVKRDIAEIAVERAKLA